MPTKLKLRSMVVAPKDHILVAADFSQAESWVVAALAQDDKMFKSLKYGDLHLETAANIIVSPNSTCYHRNWEINNFPWRKQDNGNFICNCCNTIVASSSRYLGKRINHGSSYRMHYEKQAKVINADADKPPFVTVSLPESKRYNDGWRRYYSNIPNVWWPAIEEQLNRNRTLTNAYGRRMIFNGNWGEELFRQATAWEPQSTVADLSKGMVQKETGVAGGFLTVYNQLVVKEHLISRITNESHDSIMCEVPKGLEFEAGARIKSILERPLIVNGQEFTIPVDVEYGERWGNLEKMKLAT